MKAKSLPILVIFCLLVGCSLPVATAAPEPLFDATKVVLEIQATQMSLQLTQGALAQQQSQPTPQPPADTQPPASTQASPTDNPPTEAPQATETPDMEALMKSARILVYEDTPRIGYWIRDTLDQMGLKYVHVGDAVGTFMENLNSGTKWDLIIVGAESKTKVQGEFWDVIGEKVNGSHKTALVAEVWYLDSTGNGRIKPLLTSCGIRFQRDWPLAESIYWLQSEHPVFNQPNTAIPLIHYNTYWGNQAGDLIKLAPGSEAELLAGLFPREKSSYGLVASCIEGRVIFQTFSNHDYRRDEVMLLWENFIYNTLLNHFEAIR